MVKKASKSLYKEKGTVMFVAPSAYPLGGLATWLDYLIPGLSKLGWKPILGLTAGRFHNVDAYLKVHPMGHIIRIENRTGTREGRIRSLFKAISNFQPELVVAVNIPDTYAALERLRGASRYSPKVVMTMHGIQPDLYEDAMNFRNVLDGVICTNRLACKIMQEDAKIDPERVYYAPYGVELPLEKNEFSNENGPLRIAYVGRLDHFQKRVHDIPKILKLLNQKKIEYEFKIAGGGPAELALKESSSSIDHFGKISYLGFLRYRDLVDQVYRKTDVLLVTSLWETGPIVIWEAMAYGMVVVTSSYIGSGLEGSLKNNENCLMFPIGDAIKAADCIKVLAIPKLRNSISQSGYNLVKYRYSRERSIEIWDRCFQKICLLPRRASIHMNRPMPPAGRLDRLLGTSTAESVRQIFGNRFIHNDPGGEWPHSYGIKREDDTAFWNTARVLDKVSS